MAKNEQTTDTVVKASADKAADNANPVVPPEREATRQIPAASASGAAAQATADRAEKPRKPIAIEVISRRDGFWRGDREWTIAPQVVSLRDLTEQQIDEIEDEPLLITRIIYDDERR